MLNISSFEGKAVLPLSQLVDANVLPTSVINFGSPITDILDQVHYLDLAFEVFDNGFHAGSILIFPADLEISLPGLDCVSFGIGEQGFVAVKAQLTWTNVDLELLIENIELNIRFSRSLLLPAELDQSIPPGDPKYPKYKIKGDDESTEKAKLSVTGSFRLDKDFDIKTEGFDEFNLGPVKLPNLNSVYFLLEGMKLDLSRTSAIPEIVEAGFNEDFQGVYIRNLTAVFQDDLEFLPDITAENFAIGTGGISGKITATFDLAYDAATKAFVGDAEGKLFGENGIAIGLRKFELELRANEVVSSDITGQMLFPFFDKPVEIELSFDLKGNFAVGVRGAQGNVLVELTKKDLLSMKISSFAFSKQDEEIELSVGGSIKPLFGGDIEIPEFGVNALIVSRDLEDRQWRARIEGGWITFPKEISFSAAGFRGGLRKLGWGTLDTNGAKNEFVGFSGNLSFVSGVAFAAEFDDLMFFYSPNVRVELTRARLGFLIPDAVSLIGEVSKKEDGFGGMIDITIIPVEFRIMGGAEFGRTKPPQDIFEYMQIMMALELPPPGLPLGLTPLAIRGFEGKYALNMTSSMDPGWEWVIAPPRGITPLSKMVPYKGGKMLGAGLKITSTDGTLVAINALLALMLPGPVVLIEGRGAILTKASDQSSPTDPPFYALVVINGKENYFTANLSCSADLAKGIIKVTGTVEFFFDFERPSNWHIYLGQAEPKNKRIQGISFKVLKSQMYFEMYDGPRIAAGAYVGINERKNFKVGYAVVKAYIEGGVDLSWKPEHAAGFLAFVAEITVRACGFGAGLGVSGEVDAKCPYPRRLHLEVAYRFVFNLPWPVPDVKIKGKFKKTWKDGRKYPCAFEPLIREVLVDSEVPGFPAKVLEHFDSVAHPVKLADVALVPLDARPTLSFAYQMNNDTSLSLAGNASDVPIIHKIGDDEYRFSLKNIKLEHYALPNDPVEFNKALNDLFDPNTIPWEEVTIPYGVWVADNSMTGHPAASILRLFSATPFTHFRQTMFSGGFMARYLIGLASPAAAWLNSMTGDSGLYGADTFLAQLESGAPANAANLSAAMQDQMPEYPLGMPEAQWRYLGFSDVPVQYRKEYIDITTAVSITVLLDEWRTCIPFDVIDLYFLPPAVLMSDVHNVPTFVRGIYFEKTIKLEFSIPVSECELYLYPVTRKSASRGRYPKDWPKEGLPPDKFAASAEMDLRKVSDQGTFLTFDFAATPDILHRFPPRVSARRRRNGSSDSVPNTETRDVVDNLFRVRMVADGTPFDSVMIGNMLSDDDLFLVAIGYLPDIKESYEQTKDKIEDVIENAWSGEGDAPVVLLKRSCYRLTVQTAADCDSQAPRTHVYYFRTDGPPAKDIMHYVAWTVPVSQSYPLFRNYDIAIRFRTNYVDQFFAGLPLQLCVKSDNGRIKSAAIGADLRWQDEKKHLLRPEEKAYIDVLNASNAITPIDPNAIPGDKSLIMAGGSGSGSPLEPDQAYRAALALPSESNFYVALANAIGTSYYYTQALPTMVTARSDSDKPVVDNPMLLGSYENFHKINVEIAPESVLYEFNFRTSKFLDFRNMFIHLVEGNTVIPSVTATNTDALRAALNALAAISAQLWRPAQLAVWEKQLLIQQRSAKDEELLELLDNRANANQQLDQTFAKALEQLPDLAGLLLQPYPKKVQVYFSKSCILVELPEPVEFARVSVVYKGFDVLVACSSDESRWLIFPADSSNEFVKSGILSFIYHLDIGDNYPRLRYGSLRQEHVQISLGVV